jgi:hypothetical protein
MKKALASALLAALVIAPAPLARAAEKITPAALWELAMMGVGETEITGLAAGAGKRAVELAIVGTDGVSAGLLSDLLVEGNTLLHHGCAEAQSNTHDTQEARVILDLTRPLGVQVHLHCFQAGEPTEAVAAAFREAAKVADVAVTFQSFWGADAALITAAIRESPRALVLSPYVEHGGFNTIETPQGHAAKPWDAGSIGHFATVVPLAFRAGDGKILRPVARGELDTEVINFVAPSSYASSAGGTCPSAAVAVAVACYVYGASAEKPSPDGVIGLLRRTAKVDRAALTSLPPFTAAAVDALEGDILALVAPPAGGRRTLDAAGVLHLGEIRRALLAQEKAGNKQYIPLEERLRAIDPVFDSFTEALARIEPKYPEMAGFRKEKAKGQAEDAIWCGHSHNLTRPTAKRAITPSDFGEHGFTVRLLCKAIEDTQPANGVDRRNGCRFRSGSSIGCSSAALPKDAFCCYIGLRHMKIRFYVDPQTGHPHIENHGVREDEFEDVLRKPGEDRPGTEGSRVAIG